MVDALHLALRYGHIVFGLMWAGTILVMTLVVFPKVGKWEPGHQRVFFKTMTRGLFHYAEGSAILTIVLGVALYGYLFSIGSLVSFTAHGTVFLLALVLSLLVWVMGFFILFPRLKRVNAIMDGMKEPGPPPEEVVRLMKPLPTLSNIAVVLVFVILALMVVGVTGAYQ